MVPPWIATIPVSTTGRSTATRNSATGSTKLRPLPVAKLAPGEQALVGGFRAADQGLRNAYVVPLVVVELLEMTELPPLNRLTQLSDRVVLVRAIRKRPTGPSVPAVEAIEGVPSPHVKPPAS